MTEINVVPDENLASESVQEAAHETAVAEGSALVHSEQASEASAEAKMAAEVASTAAQLNMEATAAVEQSAMIAQEAAEESAYNAQSVQEALTGLSNTLNSFVEEYRSSQPAQILPEKTPKTPQTPPKKKSWWYGK